ncbi:MAG: hypothetical protein JWR50_145 [Mucilaginibacter sp.]|nr:hypothetical protein [Mucilaginibacter sp.]
MSGLLLLGSCKKNVLDITPTDRISESSVWTDPTLPQLFINAQYNALQDGFTQDVQYFGDECYTVYDLGHYLNTIGKDAVTPDNINGLPHMFYYWNDGYTAIRNFNLFFDNIDKAPVSADIKAQMIAEVKFLRAFVYARLIWNYGGIPIIEKAYTLNETLTGVKRNTYDECVTYILNDLNAAIATLPAQQTGANLGRASADAARALKARVLLYYASPLNNPSNDQQRWKDASDAALDLINTNHYSLATDYHSLFIGGANNEIIFGRYYSTANATNIGFYSGPQGNGGYNQRQPTQNLVDAYEMTNGVIPVINGAVNPDPNNHYDPNNPYVNRDPRFYASILYNGATFKGRQFQPYKGGTDFNGNDATATGYGMYKFIDQNQPVAFTNPYTYPWVFFRLGEVYLNYAEAQYNLGNEDNARLYINKVRARVNMPPITESGTALFNRLVHERQVELAFEVHRYYDTRRWKIAPQTEVQPLQGFIITDNGNNNFNYNRVNLATRSWGDKLYYLPITTQEVRSSGGSLAQTTGY